MRCLFLAPLKSPDDPNPSGDRTMARLFMTLLRRLGYEVALASGLRTFTPDPTPARWAALEAAAQAEIARLVGGAARGGPIACVFTYHLYYKAPDLVGPRLAAALGAPYVVAEATRAPKRAAGPFAEGHHLAERAIDAADLVLALTARDRETLDRLKPPGQRIVDLKPFLDLEDWPLAGEHMRTAAETVRLVTVAMMRDGDKLASYRQLAAALALLPDRPFTLDIVGDGPARGAVEAAFAALGPRVRFRGAIADRAALGRVLAGADLFAWPAVNEAFGAVFLEAQAHGLPCVAGHHGGVADVVRDGETGVLTPPDDVAAFAAAVGRLIDAPDDRARLGGAAWRFVSRERSLEAAARVLGAAFDAAGVPRSSSSTAVA